MEATEGVEPAAKTYENVLSAEKMALVDFVYSLGSCYVNSEPGNADEGTTRQEAELLMSLLSSAPRKLETLALDPISSSESEHSFGSLESSQHSSSSARYGRTFRFTCPSLSLESSEPSAARFVRPTSVLGRVVSDGAASEPPRPSSLLKRMLHVDDRDALRLSADAMARNMHLTIQKALSFRIESWIRACSSVIIEKEQAMRRSGARQEELQILLQTREAILIQSLQVAARKIYVTSAVTSFEIQGPCDPTDGSIPASKKQRIVEDPSDLEEGDYQYKTSYSLVLKIIAALQTPAGFSEISIDVPGIIEATFLSMEDGSEELKCVIIEIDTQILAAMVEKSTRTVVRASVESMFSDESEAAADYKSAQATIASPKRVPHVLTPQKVAVSSTALVKGTSAVVTPARPSSSGSKRSASSDEFHSGSSKSFLSPVPDNFGNSSVTYATRDPHRVSPQPHATPEVRDDHSSPTNFLAPRRVLFHEDNDSALVTPSVNESSMQYQDSQDGPSLPLLAAACQAVQHTTTSV